MAEGATAEASHAGHAAKEAAKETVDELLDLILGILVPLALFIIGYISAVQIGGYTVVGNFIWNTAGGGSGTGSAGTPGNGAKILTGPQTGAITGAIFAGAWGVVAIALLRASKTGMKWMKWICRSVGAFFAGLAAFSVYFIFWSLTGGSAAQVLGSGGILDTFFGTIQQIGGQASGTPAGSVKTA